MKEIYIVSYPRSGNTWMRFLMANILYPNEDIHYKSLNRFVPDLHQKQHWGKSGVKNPRVIKSHFIWLPDTYEKVVYIYRDGRDVARSYYLYHREDKKMSFEEYLKGESRFSHFDGRGGGDAIGGWKEHVNFWLFHAPKSVLVATVRYEDLYADPYVVVRKIVDALGWDIDDKLISQAIRKSSWEELKKIQPRDGQHPRNAGMIGKPGGWKEFFTQEQLDIFWHTVGDFMEKLGYKK